MHILLSHLNFVIAGQRSGVLDGANGQQYVVGPEFCGGALSKGGNVTPANSDSVGGFVSSKIIQLIGCI